MEENKDDNLGKLIKIAIWLLVLGGIIFTLFLLKEKLPMFKTKKVEVINTASNRNDLANRNEDFAKAESLLGEDPSQALESYKKALAQAFSQSDIDSISFRVALATYRSGNVKESVSLFKNLISSSTVSNITKAYSVQFLAQEYFSTNDTNLFNIIFSDDPYKGFFADGNKDNALRKLVEYGKSFQALPILSLRSADYKARDLMNLPPQKQVEKENLISEIKNDITVADIGIEVLRGSPNIDQLPVIYNRKLILSTNLKRAGYILGDPTDAYVKGSDYANLYNDRNTLMFLHFNYAIYLSIENLAQNSDKIVSTLRNIYEEKDRNLKIFQYLKNKASADPKTDEVAGFIVSLVSVDNSFKNFLQTLGWKF
ncbi:MAG: hypothetical protein AAB513_01270 [Patescibacteria group bacterium]